MADAGSPVFPASKDVKTADELRRLIAWHETTERDARPERVSLAISMPLTQKQLVALSASTLGRDVACLSICPEYEDHL